MPYRFTGYAGEGYHLLHFTLKEFLNSANMFLLRFWLSGAVFDQTNKYRLAEISRSGQIYTSISEVHVLHIWVAIFNMLGGEDQF